MTKKWIYLVECDFCFELDYNGMKLYHVDVAGSSESYVSCLKCLVEKGWYEL